MGALMKKNIFNWFFLSLIILLILLTLVPNVTASLINHIVFSEIYYDARDEANSEFIELYNPTNKDINISGWTINDSGGIEVIIPSGKIIKAYGFFLIADEGWSTGKDDSSWPNADVEDEMSLSNSNYGLALMNGSNLIDAVGWGNAPTGFFEGTALTIINQGNSSERKSGVIHYDSAGNGYDTNNNSNDFRRRTTPQPQNSSNSTEFNPAPLITNESITPQIIYNNYNVTLNATILDNDIRDVWISGNWSGSWVNYTSGITNISNVYSFIIGSGNLSNQQFVGWLYYANDSLGQLSKGALQTFTVQNRNPTLSGISSITFNEDETYIINLSQYSSDLDNDNLTFSSNTVQNITINVNATSGTTTLIPDHDWYGTRTGTERVTFIVNDPYGGSGSQAVSINVISINDNPVISTIPNQTMYEDNGSWTLDLTVYESDIEDSGTGLNWSVTHINYSLVNVTITDIEDDIVTFTPVPNASGTSTILLILNDSDGGVATQNLTIILLPVNDAPQINGTIPNQIKTEDFGTWTLDLTQYEYDNEDSGTGLNWSVSNVNTSLITIGIDKTNDIVSFTTVANTSGTNTINLTLTDSEGLTASQNILITITQINDPPTMPVLYTPQNNSNITSSTNSIILKWNNSIDIEKDSIVYLIFFSSNNSNITLKSITMNNNLTINNLVDNTTYYWYVIASDSMLNSTKSETWQFLTKFNNAPVIINFTPTDTTPYVAENSSIKFTHLSTDPDGDAITYSWLLDSIEKATTQNWTYSPNFVDAGVHNVTLIIKDTNNNTNSQYWGVIVTDTNRQPSFTHLITNLTATEDSLFTYDFNATDPDSDNSLMYIGNMTDTNFTINSSGYITWVPSNNFVGINWINVTACDNASSVKCVTAIFFINVSNVNDAPTIDSFYPSYNNPKIAANSGTQTFNITKSDVDIGDTLNVRWTQNGVNISSSDSYKAENLTAGNYIITVIVNDSSGNFTTHTWNLTVSKTPISDLYSGSFASFNSSQLGNATNVTINHSNFGEINFGSNVLNLTNVIDIDRFINISRAVIAIDTNPYPQLNKSATLIMRGLSFNRTPIIFYSSGFGVSGNIECPTTLCTNISYNASIGVLRFNVAHFTTYFVQANTSNNPPVITSNPVTTAVINQIYNYDIDAADADNDSLTYSLATSPSGMTINSSSGLVQWIPSSTGSFDVVINVSDGTTAVTQSYSITVSESSISKLKLEITDLDIKINGESDKNIKNNSKIKQDAKPGDEIEFKIKVKNTYTKDEDLDIENIEVRITIKDIDDGDDLEEESSEFDLDAQDDKKLTLKFKIPYNVDEDNYDVEIEVKGEDENNTEHELIWNLQLEIDKEKHEVIIKRADLSPTTLICNKKSNLNVEIINIGSNDEDDVKLEIKSTKLGIDSTTMDIELSEDPDDNMYDKRIPISLTNDFVAGIYPIFIKLYRDSKLDDSKTVNLIVKDCKQAVIEKVEEDVEVQKGKIIEAPTRDIVVQHVKKPVTKVSFRETEEYLMLLAILFILLAGLVIFTVGAFIITMRKKK
jgi:hypothetical protein